MYDSGIEGCTNWW